MFWSWCSDWVWLHHVSFQPSFRCSATPTPEEICNPVICCIFMIFDSLSLILGISALSDQARLVCPRWMAFQRIIWLPMNNWGRNNLEGAYSEEGTRHLNVFNWNETCWGPAHRHCSLWPCRALERRKVDLCTDTGWGLSTGSGGTEKNPVHLFNMLWSKRQMQSTVSQ